MADPKSVHSKQFSLKDSLPVGSEERSQLTNQLTPRTRHGGDPSIGRRKTTRPFTAKAPVHLVMRSKRAKGAWSLIHRKNRSRVTSMIYVYAERFKVHVYRAAVVGNHLHLLVKAAERKNLADFLRVLAGRVAVVVSGAKRGIKKIGRFWDYLYWSRLVNWGRDFHLVRKFITASETDENQETEMSEIIRQSLFLEYDLEVP